MRNPLAPLASKFFSMFFAATLALGLLPVQALAVPDSLSLIPEGDEGAVRTESSVEEDLSEVFSHCPSDEVPSADAGSAAIPSEDVDHTEDALLPAGDVINQTMPLSTVAQAESTRSYFLAETLESTKTVPVVSAKLPLDSGTNQGAQAGADGGQIAVGSEDKVTDGDLPAVSTEAGSGDEAEGGEDSDESDLEGAVTLPGISAESTVVGSFIYRGITYAVEPGGESVAIVAADYSKLPSEFIEAQTIVLPSMVSSDGIDYYTVSRIADYAFSSLTEEVALAASGDADADASSDVDAEEGPSVGITAITIPASITEIGDDAFTGFGTLQFVIVSEDNPIYSMYDGVLYDVDLTTLLYVPEGRTGTLHVTSATTINDRSVFDRCAVDTLAVDSDDAIHEMNGITGIVNKHHEEVSLEASERVSDFFDYSQTLSLEMLDEMIATVSEAAVCALSHDVATIDAGRSTAGSFVACILTPTATGDVMYQVVNVTLDDADGAQTALDATAKLISDANNYPCGYHYYYCHFKNASRHTLYYNVVAGPQTGSVVYPAESPSCSIALPPGASVVVSFLHTTSTAWRVEQLNVQLAPAHGLFTYLKHESNLYQIIKYSFSLTQNGAGQPVTAVDLNGSTIRSGSWPAISYPATTTTAGMPALREFVIREIGGEDILDYDVEWNAASYGGTIRDSLGAESDVRRDVVSHDNDETPTVENIVSMPSSSDLAISKGFSFKGWAAQKKSDDAFETDVHGNKVLNEGPDSRYKVYNETTSQTGWVRGPFTEDSQIIDDEGNSIPGETLADWKLVIDEDTTFYAVFEADFTFNGSSYGGKVQEQDSDGAAIAGSFVDEAVLRNVRWGDVIEGPEVEDKGDGWNFEGWVSVPNDGVTQLTSQGGALAPSKTVTPKDDPANATYYGVWSCDIDWVNSDESAGSIDPSGCMTNDVVFGTIIACPIATSKDTHQFFKWEGAGSESTGASIQVLQPGEIAAVWAPNIYKVVFKDKNGNDRTDAAVANLFVKYADGWYRDAGCTNAISATLPGSSTGTTTRSGFELIGYGRDADAIIPEFFYSSTSASDYAFSATENPAGNDIFSDSTTSSTDTWTDGDITLKVAYLYPVWKATATWVWDDDGVTADAVEAKTVNNDSPTVVCRDQGSRPGYAPAGWKVSYSNGESDDAVYTTGQTITLKGDATITAQWSPILYDITLDLGEVDHDGEVFRDDGGDEGLVGSVSMSGSGGTKGTSVTAKARYDVTNGSVTLPTFSRPGFSLLGWKVVSGPSGAGANGSLSDQVADDASDYAPYTFSTAAGSAQVRGAMTFEAVWTEALAYPMTAAKTLDGAPAAGDYYDASKADIPTTYTVSGTGKLENLVPRTSPSGVAGYRFVGWSASVDGFLVDATTGNPLARDAVSDEVRIASGFVNRAVTLTAHFESVYHDLTVDLALPDAQGAYSTSANWTRPDAASNVYAYRSSKLVDGETGGYSLYDTMIALPTPTRTGQLFKGWKVEKLDESGNVVVTDVATLVQTGSDWALPVSLDHLGNYRMTALWGASDYTLAFSGIEHASDKVTGDFVSATDPVEAAYDATSRTFSFTGDDLTANGEIEVSAPDYDSARYDSFIGWYLPAGTAPSADTINAWSYDVTAKRYYLPAFTISQANLDALFSARDETGAYLPLSLEAVYEMKSDHMAILDLGGGKLVADDGSWTESANGTFSLAYSSDTSKRMLPDVSRYGYEFCGWVLTDAGTGVEVEELANVAPSADGVKRLNVVLSKPSAEDEEGYWIPADAVGDRIYTAQWRALIDLVVFDYNAAQLPGSGSNGPAPQDVTFGSVIPNGLAAPQREGYEFCGYFDTAASTGGVQYLTSSMSPARLWDKAPVYADDEGTTIVAHVLYARWAPASPEGTNPENEPKPATMVPAPPAEPDPALSTRATFSAKKGEGSSIVPATGFDAYYNGWFTRGLDDVVTVSIDSYVLCGITARDIYDAFERTGEAKPYLQGFIVDSTRSIIAFSDIARGASFSFSFKVSDMGSDIADAASFSLEGLKLTALYTDAPYDFTDPGGGDPPSILPKEGDEILATFDAAGGAFSDGSSSTCTQTTYRSGSSEHVTLPEEPTREGHTFLGWSLRSEHASDDDHAKNPSSALFHIEDTLVKHYVAHWSENSYKVHLYRNDGTSAHLRTEVAFGTSRSLSELLGAEPYEPPIRDGYLFLGYFDDETGGTQYYGRDGTASKPFDKVASSAGYASLYARWLPLGGGSGSPGDIDPANPFPPHDDVVIVAAASPDDVIRMVARDGLGNATTLALDGTYDGYYAHTSSTDDASVSVCSYRASSVETSVRKVIERFEANNDPALSGGAHLQGFEVLSTGSFVSVADLWAGAPITLVCKTTDLDAACDPASAVFATGAVVAIYGPTSPIAPDDPDTAWPEAGDPTDPSSGTRVTNVFDARGGLFSDGRRFCAIDSGYGLAIRAPSEDPSYDAIDPSYLFAGWFDASGNRFDPASTQMTTAPATYYARYEHVEMRFVLHDSQMGVRDIHKQSVPGDDTIAELTVHKGQELTETKTNGLGQPIAPVSAELSEKVPDERTGYDFIGWFYEEPLTGELVPFYLNAFDLYASQFIQKRGYEVVSAYTNSASTGWGDVTGAEGQGDRVDLYALWNVESYTIRWTYNWTERDYVYTEADDAGVSMPAASRTVTVEYGDAVGTDEGSGLSIPLIKDPAYAYLGWYAGKTTTGNDEVLVAFEPVEYTEGGHAPDTRSPSYADARAGSREPTYFVYEEGTRRFEPANIDGIDERGRTFELFACFADEAMRYDYRIYFGKSSEEVHGKVSNKVGTIVHDDELDMDYLAYSYLPALGANLSSSIGSTADLNHIEPDPGYSLAGYYESPESGSALAEPVTIEKWTTGLQVFYLGWTANPYHVRLTLSTLDLGETDEQGETILSAPSGTVVLNGAAAYDLDLGSDDGRTMALPTPTGALGYVFCGWKRCDPDGTLWQQGDVIEDGALTFDAAYVADAFGGASEGTVFYGAVWEAIPYQVRFHVQRDADDGFDLFDAYTLMGEGTGDASHPASLVLPYPHTKGVSDIFAYWSLETFDGAGSCEEWASGTELSLEEMFEMQRRLGLAEATDSMEDVRFAGIDIYAQWRGVVGADVPLQVNMLFDPFAPNEPLYGKVITNATDAYLYDGGDTVIANGWVGTTSSRQVRIESLTFERGDDALFERRDGTDGGSDLDLLIYGGGRGDETTEPLRLNLGVASTVVLRDDATSHGASQSGHIHGERLYLADHGMAKEFSANAPLYLYYDLDIRTADGTLTSYAYLMDELLDATEASGSSIVRKAAPLAKLYYTIGLAQ